MAMFSTHRFLFSTRSSFRGAVWILLLASVPAWTGCSGGSSTEEAEDANQASEENAPAAAEEKPAEQSEPVEVAEEPEPPGEAPFDTTFLDAQTELFVHARVGDVLDSSLVKMMTGGSLGPLTAMKQQLDLSPRDIETVTIGISNLAKLAEQSAESMPLMASAMMGPQQPSRLGGSGGDDEGMDDSEDDAMEMEDEFDDTTDEGDADDTMDGESGGGNPQQQKRSPQGAGKGVVAVVRTKTPIDPNSWGDNPGVEQLRHGKKAFYRITAGPTPEAPCIYLYDSTTLVASDEITIKEVIDQGEERPRPTADLGFLKATPHVLLAVAPKDKAALKEAGSLFNLPGAGLMSSAAFPGGPQTGSSSQSSERFTEDDGLVDDDTDETGDADEGGDQGSDSESDAGGSFFDQHADAFALLIDLSEGISLNVVLKCDTDAAAQQITAEIDSGLGMGKSQFEAMKSNLPGVVRIVAQPVVDSLAASAAADVVTVSVALPEEQQALLPVMSGAMMGMMMGGMGPGPGGGGFAQVPSLAEFAMEALFEGQPAANASEVPAGLELKALTRWGQSVYGEQGPPPLEIGIVAQGGPAASAIAFGQLNLIEARSDESTSLKWTGTLNTSAGHDPIAGLVPIERDAMMGEHPRDAVATGFAVAAPSSSISSLAAVVGEVVLQVPGEVQDVMYADVLNIQGSPPTGTGVGLLDELRFDLTTINRGDYDELEVTFNRSALVGPMVLTDPSGVPVEPDLSNPARSGERKTVTYRFHGRIPAATSLRLSVYADVKTLVVPFRFENLPVPPSPQLTAEQQALLVWTAVEPPGSVDDLTIEAQGRWRALERVAPISRPAGPGFGNRQRRLQAGDADGAESDDADMDLDDEGGDDGEMELDDAGDEADDGGGGGGGRGRGRGRLQQETRPELPQSENPLRIVIDLIGPLTQTAEGIGFADVSSATSDIDTDLAFEGAEFGEAKDLIEQFVVIDREKTAKEDHPPGGLRVVLKLTPPKQPIQALARLNGTLKFKTVRERVEAIVPEIESRVGRPFSSPSLTKHRMKPVVLISGNQLKMRLFEGKEDRLAEVIPVDLNGDPISRVKASKQSGGAAAADRTIYVFDFPGGIPQKLGLKFIVNMGVQEVSIPIRIENLPLPPMPVPAA